MDAPDGYTHHKELGQGSPAYCPKVFGNPTSCTCQVPCSETHTKPLGIEWYTRRPAGGWKHTPSL